MLHFAYHINFIYFMAYFKDFVELRNMGTPQKKSGAKNMQNFGRFWTTSDFDREYLRNG